MHTPEQLGRYRVLRRLGEGSHGTVFLAEAKGPHSFRHHVAIKLIRASAPSRISLRFANEARILCSLRHPNIVGFLGFEETPEGDCFLVMDYLDGFDLDDLVSILGPLPAGVVAGIARQALIGLAFAHRLRDHDGEHHPVIHRDLKPANLILCGDGFVRILDFGLATADFRPWESVAASGIRGSPRYMAPEQLRGQTSARSDLFSLALVMFELLTGEHVYNGRKLDQILMQARDADIEPRLARLPRAAAPLRPLLRRALALDPAERFQTALSMSKALVEAKLRLAPPGHLLTLIREARARRSGPAGFSHSR